MPKKKKAKTKAATSRSKTKRKPASERLRDAHAKRGGRPQNGGRNAERAPVKLRRPSAMSIKQWAKVLDGLQCGGRLKGGGFCRKAPVAGQADISGRQRPFRCSMHGGTSVGAPIGNKHAVTHGAYVKALLPGEAEIAEQFMPDTLDGEIIMTKVRLRRALIDEKDQIELLRSENPKLALVPVQKIRELVTRTSDDGTSYSQVSMRVVRGLRTVDTIIHGIINQLARLMQQRANLIALAQDGDGTGTPEDRAQRARDALAEMEREVYE